MNEILEKLCELTEKENPKFDRNNPHDLDAITKTFVVSQNNKEITKSYLETVVAEQTRLKLKDLIDKFGQQAIECEMKILELEKQIVEKRIEIVKSFMN